MRVRNFFAVAAVSSFVVCSTPALAEGSANTFLEAIDNQSNITLLILDGYTNGMDWMNTELGAIGQPLIYCAPTNLSITADQNADILRKHVQANKWIGESPAGLALLEAYKATFPCGETTQ